MNEMNQEIIKEHRKGQSLIFRLHFLPLADISDLVLKVYSELHTM